MRLNGKAAHLHRMTVAEVELFVPRSHVVAEFSCLRRVLVVRDGTLAVSSIFNRYWH
jgi:hypothetical protein